jgi:hypothetical protein
VWWRCVGLFKWLTGQKQRWGDMQRRGVVAAGSAGSTPRGP